MTERIRYLPATPGTERDEIRWIGSFGEVALGISSRV